MDDRTILEALEKIRKPVQFIDFVAELSPHDPAPIYDRILILKRRGYVIFSGQPEMVSITTQGFDYLRELRAEDYTKSKDKIARIIALVSLGISLASLVISIVGLVRGKPQ